MGAVLPTFSGLIAGGCNNCTNVSWPYHCNTAIRHYQCPHSPPAFPSPLWFNHWGQLSSSHSGSLLGTPWVLVAADCQILASTTIMHHTHSKMSCKPFIGSFRGLQGKAGASCCSEVPKRSPVLLPSASISSCSSLSSCTTIPSWSRLMPATVGPSSIPASWSVAFHQALARGLASKWDIYSTILIGWCFPSTSQRTFWEAGDEILWVHQFCQKKKVGHFHWSAFHYPSITLWGYHVHSNSF